MISPVLSLQTHEHLLISTPFSIGVFGDLELEGNPYIRKFITSDEIVSQLMTTDIFACTTKGKEGVVVQNPYTKQVPKERIIPRSNLRILKSVGQGMYITITVDPHLSELRISGCSDYLATVSTYSIYCPP